MKAMRIPAGQKRLPMMVMLIVLMGVGLCMSETSWGQSRNSPEIEERKAKAREMYERFEAAYLRNDWDVVDELLPKMRGSSRYLKANERQAVMKATSFMDIFRPRWWRYVSSKSRVSFKASMWERDLTINYVPDENQVGMQAYLQRSVGGRVVEIIPVVSWRPQYIGSKKPAVGGLAELHDLTMGDYVEVIVRHELGHNYITKQLPPQDVIQLLRMHNDIFGVLQEFYADLTALRHSTPKAMRIACWARLNEFDREDHYDPHLRAAMGIGFVLLHEFMAHPEKWPSVHFPAEVPEEDVLLTTLKYVYEHWSKDWSLVEDMQLREFVTRYLKSHGDKVFRDRGTVMMRGAAFAMMPNRDGKFKERREKYLKRQLERLIKSGRADEPKSGNHTTLRLDAPYEAAELEKLRRQGVNN